MLTELVVFLPGAALVVCPRNGKSFKPKCISRVWHLWDGLRVGLYSVQKIWFYDTNGVGAIFDDASAQHFAW